jgi:hypothetical protein
MRSKCHKLREAVLILAGIFAPAGAMAAEPPPLVIREQGSFAVGGTVVTNSETFDPLKPTPEGQTFHGDHAYVFFRSR